LPLKQALLPSCGTAPGPGTPPRPPALKQMGRRGLKVAVVGACVLALLSALDARGFRKAAHLRAEVETLRRANRQLSEDNAALTREIQAQRVDVRATERAVREELGYVRPGELVFQVE
jgi:cell division protein FtsB